MLHFPCFFQIYDISKALLWSKGLSGLLSAPLFIMFSKVLKTKLKFFLNFFHDVYE